MLETLRKYAVFSGRARRAEYWKFAIAVTAVTYGLIYLGGSTGKMFITILAFLVWAATLAPLISVTVRRLHDTGRSGAWFFIGFLPFIGGLILIVLLLLPGESEENTYGPNPRPVAAVA